MAQPVFINDLRIGGPPLAIHNDDGTTQEISMDHLWRLLYPGTTDAPQINQAVAQTLEQYEQQWGVNIPTTLKTVASWTNIRHAICHAFPTNNDFCVPGSSNVYYPDHVQHWHLVKQSVVSSVAPDMTHMVRFINENQGCCFWYAAWNNKDEKCKVYVSYDVLPEQGNNTNDNYEGGDPFLTSDDLLTFLIDYTLEGGKWYQQYGQ